jgi:hypothetical protein
MDAEVTPIGQWIDNELLNLLGKDGFGHYLGLCRETAANRDRIIDETRQLGRELFHGELARLMQALPQLSMDLLQVNARMAAIRNADRERDRRLAEEQRLFTERCNRLVLWVEERRRPDCPGCE